MPIIIQNRNQDVFNYVNCVLKVKINIAVTKVHQNVRCQTSQVFRCANLPCLRVWVPYSVLLQKSNTLS